MRPAAAAFFAPRAHAARSQRRRTDTCAKIPGNSPAGSHREAAPDAQEFPLGRESGRLQLRESRAVRLPGRRNRLHGPGAAPLRAARKLNRVSVDRPRPSDMVENRKTCGISTGSVSSIPPVTLATVNVRRLAKMASGDDHKAGWGGAKMGAEVTKSNSSQRADFVPAAFSIRGRTPAISIALLPEARGARVLAPFTPRFYRSQTGLMRGSRSAARALQSLPFRSIRDLRIGG